MGNSVRIVRVPLAALSAEPVALLAQLLRENGATRPFDEALEGLPRARVLETLDSSRGLGDELDALVRAHGDLKLLGWLLAEPGRRDVEAHLARVPAGLAPLARLQDLFVVTPEEHEALRAAHEVADREGEAEEWWSAVLEPLPADAVELWSFQGGPFGEWQLEKLPVERPAPKRSTPPVMPGSSDRNIVIGCVALLVLGFGLLALLIAHFS